MKLQRQSTLNYGGIFDRDLLNSKILHLQKKTLETGFWDDNKKAQSVTKKISSLESEIELWDQLEDKYTEVEIHFELLETDNQPDPDIEYALSSFIELLENVELRKMLNSPDDHRGAILTIHPGAGGTESQDWANMLYRLYMRWCERSDFKTTILDFQPGDEAGIKDVTIEIVGEYAYGYLKAEVGVHRLVRISPFDSNSRRHTSFASVFIYPLIEDDVEVELSDKEIRIDTYRASGAGGQHVNKTDSAVRITHLPTKIVVQCQNERSQLKNKNTAMKMLKAKLYQRLLEEKVSEHQKLEEQKLDIGWGSQIRSYIFHPYNLVKDHRTKEEIGNIQSVMDGEINPFIRAYLLKNMEKTTSDK